MCTSLPEGDASLRFYSCSKAPALVYVVSHCGVSLHLHHMYNLLISHTSSSDGPADLSPLTFQYLSRFSCQTDGGSSDAVYNFIYQNQPSLRTVSIENPSWTFPSTVLSIRNLAHINFLGRLPPNSQAIADILTHGRQLESLFLSCHIDCTSTSHIFRSMPKALPFLRHFSFTVRTIGRRVRDPDLFPAIAEFLRGREELRTLGLVAQTSHMQCSVGFYAAVWGALPSLVNLRTLKISYPTDLAPGLASWLIPRSVGALSLTLDYTSVQAGSTTMNARDFIPFLDVSTSSKVGKWVTLF